MAEDYTTTGTYTFRGIEYVVTMNVTSGSSLALEVEDRITADQWRGSFDDSYLEDLTRKTGNYKQFQIFVNMMESAISKNSESVSLDLLTYSDLESLRSRKSGPSTKAAPSVPRNPGLNSKRYLILTYTVEFDRIHYPLPLPYMGKPDPKALQNNIRKLREEIKTLKQQGGRDHRSKEVDKLKRDYDRLLREKEELEATFVDFRREMQNTTVGGAAKEVRILKDLVKSLEHDLLKEQTKHQRAATKRSQEHRQLLDELDELKASERNLKARVKSLTNELAIYKRRNTGSRSNNASTGSSRGRHTNNNCYSSRENSYSKDNSRVSRYSTNNSYSSRKSLDRSKEARSRENSLSRERSRSRDKPLYLRDRSSSRERSVSRDRSAYRDRFKANISGGSVGSYHSRSRSPSSQNLRFDPTAYIKDKEKKKKESDSKQKRSTRTNMSGSFEKKSRPSLNMGRFNGGSRASSVGSLRSRTSSIESLSDVGIASDTSEGRHRKASKVLKSARTLNAWSSPDISYTSKASNKPPKAKSKKILSSTPENRRNTSKVRNKENFITQDAGADSDVLDRSSEIGEIDARLNRLQQFMKNNFS